MTILSNDQMFHRTHSGHDGRRSFTQGLSGNRFLVFTGEHLPPPTYGTENSRGDTHVGKDDIGDEAGQQENETQGEKKRRGRRGGQLDRLILFFGHESVLRVSRCR
ncbi:MAG: hypothetical protein CMN75_17240 [Spirochaeta sp.]|nr:hypothetical protein [Spirochaeta sp.]